MMWKLTIICNTFTVLGFWLVGFIAMTPAFNYFVQYADPGEIIPLPIIARAVFSIRLPSLFIPILWFLISIVLIIQLAKKTQTERVELVQLHTAISILGGLILLVIFSIGGVLPFLGIGGFIE